MLVDYFQLTPIPANYMTGTYNISLVILSYVVATAASYVALDITGRMRDMGISRFTSYLWLIGGSLAMGTGIWSMHFIGMLAFVMSMPMAYDPTLTGLSMVIAIIASGIAFSLLKSRTIKTVYLILGGVLLGFSIASMHYVGMEAMRISMQIHYLPGLFILSIIIAIVASEAALYLALKSNEDVVQKPFLLKTCSALVMGLAICGMHYTGMAAAIFTPLPTSSHFSNVMDPNKLAMIIALVTLFILAIVAFISSIIFNARANLARQVGMAEVASNVLHNVGNVLNSVNTSASLILQHLRKIDLNDLTEINNLLAQHKQDLGTFITSDKGSSIIDYLSHLTTHWQKEYDSAKQEVARLEHNIQHIKDVISMQQSLSSAARFEELVAIDALLDEALRVACIDFVRHRITVKKDYASLKPVYLDKLKLVQILINLIRNAKESLQQAEVDNKTIVLKTHQTDGHFFFIQVIDNGIGIESTKKSAIFSHGFTTKKNGHGFGLHASAISAHQMSGSLAVSSDGINKGATFTIQLPYKTINQSITVSSDGEDHVRV